MGLKIAILGTRGVPNHYGGFEHIAGYLARGLVKRDHEVTVYNSSTHPYKKKQWQGVRIIHCFDPEKNIGMSGQFIYDLNCLLDARKRDYDMILMLGYTSSSVWAFLYPPTAIIINNMDGLEWQRAKYSKPVRWFLEFAERLAVKASDYQVADSPVIKAYLDRKYRIDCKYIAYGAELDPAEDEEVLLKYNIEKKQYYLLMARIEPENNVEMILEGYSASGSGRKFIVIGDTSNLFGQRLVKKYAGNKRIVFTGAIFDDTTTQSLTAFCRAYFHGHSVGGTNPSLLDAMAAKIPLAAHQNPFNASLLKNNTWYFNDATDVCALIEKDNWDNQTFIDNNYNKVSSEFNWDMIVSRYENYFLECYMERHFSEGALQIEEI